MENDKTVPVCTNVKEGLAHSVTSTGRQLGVVPAPTHGLWVIKYIDGRSGSLPERLTGRYTGVKFAQIDVDDFVRLTWEVAEENTPKAIKKKKQVQEEQQTAAA